MYRKTDIGSYDILSLCDGVHFRSKEHIPKVYKENVQPPCIFIPDAKF